MNIAIISSSKDLAGINTRNNLIELFDFQNSNEKFDNNDIYECNRIKNKTIKLYLIKDDLIFAENIDKRINADAFIFASKHRSKENTPSFTVHPIGNWSSADFGGKQKNLCPSSAILLKNLFVELNNNGKGRDFEITMEATHHGPYVEKPAVFVEIGSTEKEWQDVRNGEIIAKTIMSGINSQNNKCKITVGVGGPHYCSNFNKIILSSDIALSHICPKHNLDKLDENLIQQLIQKTKEKVDFILLDWKGLGQEKQRILELLRSLNLEIRRSDQLN